MVAKSVTLLITDVIVKLTLRFVALSCAKQFACDLPTTPSRCSSVASIVTRWSCTSPRYSMYSPSGKTGRRRPRAVQPQRLTRAFSTSVLPFRQREMRVMFLRRMSMRGIRRRTSSRRAMKTWSSMASVSDWMARVLGSKLSIMSSLGGQVSLRREGEEKIELRT